MRRAGFTLLEVMVAVAILAAALVALVGSQAGAVLMTTETERMLTATMLAREMMAEVQTQVEQDGFGESDIEEEGDFKNFGATETMDLQLDLGDSYDDYRYAWTVRQVDITMAGDLASLGEQLAGNGFWGEQGTEESSTSSAGGYSASGGETPGLDSLPFSTDSIFEQLGNFLREVRVVVWWGENEDGTDQVEIVTHIINPTGVVIPSLGANTPAGML